MASLTPQHRAEYLLARAIEKGLGSLSSERADQFGEWLGSFVRRPLGIRRGLVDANLRIAFPDASDAWIDEVARGAYRHLGREVVSMLRLAQLDPAGVRATVEIPADVWANFEEAHAEGRGVILATGHYGNWEMAAAAVAARGVPIAAIVKGQSNPAVNDWIEEVRRGLGVETVDMARARRRIPRDLAANKGIGIVADQDARHSGVWVPFFGRLASTYRGPALFAIRYGAPIFAAVCRRKPDGNYLLTGTRLEIPRTDSLEEDVLRLTALLARHLEEEIRVDPTQYLWLHKRWKTAPPEEPGTSGSGTNDHGGRSG